MPLALLSRPVSAPVPLHIISMAPQAHRIDNVVSHGFDVHTVGPRQRGVWEMLLSATPVKDDVEAQLPPLALKVMHAGPLGATSVRVRFADAMASSHTCLLIWDGVALAPLRPPQSGQSLTLPYRRGPTSL